jgi:hypothetical protein
MAGAASKTSRFCGSIISVSVGFAFLVVRTIEQQDMFR